MKGFVRRLKQRLSRGKAVLCDSTGLSVVELILILVGIFTPYYGVGIRCMA